MERRFFRDVCAWSAAILLGVFSLNYVVDPFGANRRFDLGLPKDRVSAILDYRLYKLLAFRANPQPIVIFGDSRCDAWKSADFEAAGMPNVFNFAFGGGTLFEAIDAFWFAASTARVREAVFCVPFSLFSDGNASNRFGQARNLAEAPSHYYMSTFVTKASLQNLYTALTGHLWRGEAPAMDRAAFWSHQLGPEVTGVYYRSWRRPADLAARLEEVHRYASEHGIVLRFAIPPTHVDLQAQAAAYGLEDEVEEYRCDLAKLADLVDFDFPSPLTRDAGNFKDPYHLNETRGREVVADFATGSTRWSRHFAPAALPPHCEAKAAASSPAAAASGPP